MSSSTQRSAGPPPAKEGWVYKANENGYRYKKRWLVLDRCQFVYRKKQQRTDKFLKEPRYLKEATMNPLPNEFPSQPKTKHPFRIKVPGRMYFFCAETKVDMEHWVEAFEEHITYSQIPEATRDAPPPPTMTTRRIKRTMVMEYHILI